mgnify:CR=1 FL=1
MAVNAKGQEITSIWTPANVVTCVRIVFIPVFMVVASLAFEPRLHIHKLALSVVAFVLYALLSLTDKLDGHLARSRGEVTDFGKFLDPIADKLLVFSALLLLLDQGYTNVWYVSIILFREFLVSALRMVASANGEVIAADTLGKWKTACTMVSLCGFYLAFCFESQVALTPVYGVLFVLSQVLLFAAVVLTVVSGAQYFRNARNIIFRV